jgi:hypothetical protein
MAWALEENKHNYGRNLSLIIDTLSKTQNSFAEVINKATIPN